MLEGVEWGEYRLGDLFESENGDFDIQKHHINDLGEYVVTAGLSNNGVLGRSNVKAKVFFPQTFTVDMFGTVFYRVYHYKMVTHARVFSLSPKFEVNNKQGTFIATALSRICLGFGYENMCSWVKIRDKKVQLPTRKGKIDFEFMEKFIAELNASRLAELNAYLSITGLNNYILTPEEEQVLADFEAGKTHWGKYQLGELFRRRDTKKLFYKAKELPKEPVGEYTLPCLTSSFLNQGLNYYVPRENSTILKEVISIPSNSDVYRAYYQSRDFTVLSDAYAIEWGYGDVKISDKQYLFLVSSINQVTDLPIYSYKNKLGGWNVVQEKDIELPILNGEIDYTLMDNFISAIQKLVIKDVALYAERELYATQAVITQD